jgi:hypothetical protein
MDTSTLDFVVLAICLVGGSFHARRLPASSATSCCSACSAA